jgi:hypothetical protein
MDSHSAEVPSTRQDYNTRVIMNPAYRDDSAAVEHSFLSATVSSASTTAPEPACEVDEVIIRGIRSSSRLFFEPEATSSILTKPSAEGCGEVEFGGARAVARVLGEGSGWKWHRRN